MNVAQLGDGTTKDLGNGLVEITDLNGFLADLKKVLDPVFEEQRETWDREGPAAMSRAQGLSITIDSLGGNCPVQGYGSFDGKRFYFRARHDEWQFHVADSDGAVFDPDAWVIEREYGDDFDAGWMPKHIAVGFICQSVEGYRRSHQETQG